MRQLSRVNGNRLERMGSLDFDFYAGACAVINDDKVYLCFNYDVYDDSQKLCRFSSRPEENFQEIAKSTHEHGTTSIAASQSKFLEPHAYIFILNSGTYFGSW